MGGWVEGKGGKAEEKKRQKKEEKRREKKNGEKKENNKKGEKQCSLGLKTSAPEVRKGVPLIPSREWMGGEGGFIKTQEFA